MFPKFKNRKAKRLSQSVLDEEKLADKIVLKAKELQEKEAIENKRQRALSIYATLTPRQKRKFKIIAERKGVNDGQG